MQQYAQAAKGLLANLSRDLKELNIGDNLKRLPEVIAQQLQPTAVGGADPLGASSASASASAAAVPRQQQQPDAASSATVIAPAAPPPPSGAAARRAIDERAAAFKRELLGGRVDLARLRALAVGGVPDRDGLRALTWKLLLGYLPPDPAGWDELLARRRAQYAAFCDELIVDPKRAAAEAEAGGANPLGARAAAGAAAEAAAAGSSGGGGDRSAKGGGGSSSGGGSADAGGGGDDGDGDSDPLSSRPSAPQRLRGRDAADHPLALDDRSAWHVFFKDGEVMEQIDRDVMRTHPDMHFFSGDGPEVEARRAEMRRALFLFAKLNPGVRYVQGMNELLAPLYHTFKTDPDPGSAAHAEADAFFCLGELLARCELRDLFCAQLDGAAGGARATAARLAALLRAVDPPLARHVFEANAVDPQFFAFRWITLMLTQELPFPDAVRAWDTILADPRGRMDCLLRVCLALLLRARGALLAGDFAANVKHLQRYPPVDVGAVLRDAAALPACDDLVPPLDPNGGGGGGGSGGGGGVGGGPL